MSEGKSYFDIEKRQKYLFDAAVQNAQLANSAITLVQSSFLALGFAELAFLGVVLFVTNQKLLTKVLISLLVFSFVLFLLGAIRQYRYALRKAREFEGKSNHAVELMHEGVLFTNSEPEGLSVPKEQIKTDKVTDHLVVASFSIILLTTVGTLFMVVKL